MPDGSLLTNASHHEHAFMVPAHVLCGAAQVRVLTARDPHGSIELAQARASDGSLVIAGGHFLPEDCRDLTEILPGHFKYGWLSAPQKYAHTEEETRAGAETATAAAQRALQVGSLELALKSDVMGIDFELRWLPAYVSQRNLNLCIFLPCQPFSCRQHW